MNRKAGIGNGVLVLEPQLEVGARLQRIQGTLRDSSRRAGSLFSLIAVG